MSPVSFGITSIDQIIMLQVSIEESRSSQWNRTRSMGRCGEVVGNFVDAVRIAFQFPP